MNLSDYFSTQPRGAQQEMAEALGISETWLSLVSTGRSLPSATLAVAIQRATGGKVSREELRPDLFGDVA